MMEDTGEDILRAKPSPITTFFKRIGQVRHWCLLKETRVRLWSPPTTFFLQTVEGNWIKHCWIKHKSNASGKNFPSVLDLPDLAWPLDPAHCVPVDIHSRPHSRISRQNSFTAGESSILAVPRLSDVPKGTGRIHAVHQGAVDCVRSPYRVFSAPDRLEAGLFCNFCLCKR